MYTRQMTLDYSPEAAELLRPDPLDHQMPRAGDRIEILWTKAWPKQGWSTGRVTSVGAHIIAAKMDFNGGSWGCHLSRRDRAISPTMDKGPLWRWPEAQTIEAQEASAP